MVPSKQFAPSAQPGSNRRLVSTATGIRAVAARTPVSPAKADGSPVGESENLTPEPVTTATNQEQLKMERQSAEPGPGPHGGDISNELEEHALVTRISDLWSSHAAQRSAVGRSREQLNKLRLELGRELSHYKELYADKGRGGKWTAFLRAHNFSRATADRYVERWQESQKPKAENRLSEAVSAPSEDQIAALVKTVSARLLKRLITSESRKQFMDALALSFEQSAPSSR